MKAHKQIYFVAVLLLLAAGVGSCSLNNAQPVDGRTNSKEDLMAARQILSASISSDQSGIILSLNDAFTSISESKFIIAPYSGKHSGRGNEINYKHSYEPKSGVHTVQFKRSVQDALFSKKVSTQLHYRYRTNGGKNIKYPRKNAQRIATIYYDGRHQGQTSTLHKTLNFVRQDTFLITDVNTQTVTIDGTHHSSGSISISPAHGSSFKRNYELEINLLNITAPSSALNNNQNFWKKVSGTLSWQLQISHNSGHKKMGGTIKLGGAGMAMLRFNRQPQHFQVNLNNGDLKDPDHEFEGRITQVNLSEKRITLFNGRTLYLTSKTQIEKENFTSLKEIKNALSSGTKVWTEGAGYSANGRFTVTEIEFEQETDDPDEETENKVEFDDVVSSVNAAADTFTLFGKVTVAVNDSTSISDEGDYMQLKEVGRALKQGQKVTAEGDARSTAAGAADLTAISVEFEKVNKDNGEGEED